MKVVDYLEELTKPFISYEIIPPEKGVNIEKMKSLLEELTTTYSPPFIDVTSHAHQAEYVESGERIHKKVKRKRPGTLPISILIQHLYDTDAVPHALCHGFTKEETEDFLVDVQAYGIENILAIGGDDHGYNRAREKGGEQNKYAVDLLHQIKEFNPEFCVGVSAYPEKHFREPNKETDRKHLLEKQEAGADYAVTQMFFDNNAFRRYVRHCREEGITIPILPGLKVISSKKQLTSLPGAFHCDIPYRLSKKVDEAETDEDVRQIGVEWTKNQIVDLFENGIRLKDGTTERVPGLHLYIMQSIAPVHRLMDKLPAKYDLRRENPR